MKRVPCELCSTPGGRPRRRRRAPWHAPGPWSPVRPETCTLSGCHTASPPGQRAGTFPGSGGLCPNCREEAIGRGPVIRGLHRKAHLGNASVRQCEGDVETPPEDSERAPCEVSILYESNILSSAKSNGDIIPKLLQCLRGAWNCQSCRWDLARCGKRPNLRESVCWRSKVAHRVYDLKWRTQRSDFSHSFVALAAILRRPFFLRFQCCCS